MLAQLLELGDQRREIAVTGNNHEGIDVLLGIGQVHGVHAQANVGRVLACLGPPGNFYQFDGRLMQGGGVVAETVPVGVSPLGDDLALLYQPFQHAADVEAVAPPLKAQGQVFEIDENSQGVLTVGHAKLLFREGAARPPFLLLP